MITIPYSFKKLHKAMLVKSIFKAVGVPAETRAHPSGWRVVLTNKEFIDGE